MTNYVKQHWKVGGGEKKSWPHPYTRLSVCDKDTLLPNYRKFTSQQKSLLRAAEHFAWHKAFEKKTKGFCQGGEKRLGDFGVARCDQNLQIMIRFSTEKPMSYAIAYRRARAKQNQTRKEKRGRGRVGGGTQTKHQPVYKHAESVRHQVV